MCISLAVPAFAAEETSPFSDMKESDWFYPYVIMLYGVGVVNGVGDGTFNPNGAVTAAEFFTLAARLLMPDRIDMSSADEYWAYPYYDALVSANIIAPDRWGRAPGLWAPSNTHWNPYGLKWNIVREDMAAVLYALAKYMQEDMSILPNIENNIPDSAKCGNQALWAYSAGVITGKTDGSFDPDGKMTRAEMCTVFCRLMRYVPRVEVVVQAAPESQYFITQGMYKGKLKEDVAREYGRQALARLVIGEDKSGVYISATAPVLPQEMQHCVVTYKTFLERPNGYYFVDNLDPELKSGESIKAYFNSFSDTPVRSSQIGSMRIYVSVEVPNYGQTITYLTDTSTNQQVMEILEQDDGDLWTKINLDVSHVFNGIGK